MRDPEFQDRVVAATREPKNLAVSVRQKLLDLARARNEDSGLMLVKYGLERVLYRLSRSTYRNAFILNLTRWRREKRSVT